MAIHDYIADSALLPTFSLVPRVRSHLTDVRCIPAANAAGMATATTCRITQSFIG